MNVLMRYALLVTLSMAATGCSAPGFFGRRHVGANLECRTGHPLGPEKSRCDLVTPDTVDWADGLSQDEAVILGLWNNPGYQELLADLLVTEADVIQANQLANPQMSTMFPLSAKQWEFTLSVPVDVLLLRPRRVAAAQVESKRVAERLVQDGLDVMRDVRWGYLDLVAAEHRLRLAEEGAVLRSQIAQIAEARLAAGAVAELDVSATRLDALFGHEEAVRARHDVALARERLRFLLGIELTAIEVTTTALPEVPPLQLNVDELVGEAVACRPDLRALALAHTAACERVDLAHKDYLGLSVVLPDINAQGRKGFEAGPGLQMAIPIFHQNQGAIARAEAEAGRLRRQWVKQRDMAALEVRQAYTQLLQAQQDAWIWREQVVPQAELAVASARKALEEDGVALALVLETTRQSLDARQRELQAVVDVHRAAAELERSVGRRLFDEPMIPQGGQDILVPEPDPSIMETLP